MPCSVLCWVTSASPPCFGVAGGSRHMLSLQTPDPQPESTPVPSRCTPCSGPGGKVRTEPLRCLGLYREVSSAGHRERTHRPSGGVLTQPAGPAFLGFWGGCGLGWRGACLPRADPGLAGALPLTAGRDGEGRGARPHRRSCVRPRCAWALAQSREAAWKSGNKTLNDGKPTLQESACEVLSAGLGAGQVLRFSRELTFPDRLLASAPWESQSPSLSTLTLIPDES